MRKALALTLLTIPLLADDSCVSICDCPPAPCVENVTLANRSPKGIGYDKGYSSIDFFAVIQANPYLISYIDLRGHVFNDSKPAFNAGFGMRLLQDDCELAYGGNFFWDFKESRHTTFHQLGAGIEFLWPKWELSANGYVPINRHKKAYETGFNCFKGNKAIIFRKYETAMSGLDVTIGHTLINCPGFFLTGFLSGYYFHGDFNKKALGWMGRLRAKIHTYLTLEGIISYDTEFKWRPQGEVAFTFPFGPSLKRCTDRKTDCCPNYLLWEEKLSSKPERFEIIVSTTKEKKTVARNANNNGNFNFIFVDNTSGSSGTFEDPFATLEEAFAASKPGDVIYVLPGNGSYTPTTDLALKNGQSFVGSGGLFTVRGAGFGPVDIPPQTSTRPITDLGVNDVTIFVASDNTISGNHIIKSTSSPAILLSTISRTTFNTTVMNNFFSTTNLAVGIVESVGGGIFFSGTAKIIDNQLLAMGSSSQLFAIGLRSEEKNRVVNASFNRVGFGGEFADIGIQYALLTASATPANVILENNTMLASGSNCLVLLGEVSSGLLRNNNATNLFEEAIEITAPKGPYYILNNFAAGGTDAVFGEPSSPGISLGQINPDAQTNLKLWKNTTTTVDPSTAGIFYDGINSTILTTQSPNLQESGVRAINDGTIRFDTSGGGSFEFILFE